MNKKQSHFQRIYFILLLITVFFFYDYNNIILKVPQSTHHWRQADCVSLTLNLTQGDCDFFHPQLHNLSSDNKTTGAGVSEAPILYYTVAQLNKVFGYNIAIYRIVNTLIFFLGVFYLFKTLQILFKNSFWIYLIPLIIFISPVIVFYSSNFLTDTTAFSIALVAWYYFFKFKETTKNKFFHISILFFTITGLLKVLYLTSFVAIIFIFIIELATNIKFNTNSKIFNKGYKHIFSIAFLFVVIIAWYSYALYYNNLHSTKYFSNRIVPIWDLSFEQIKRILEHINIIHFKEYYHFSFFLVTTVILFFNLYFYKKANKFIFTITILLLLSNLAIIFLWFGAFKDHDYYFISLIIFPLFNFITFIDILKTVHLKKKLNITIQFVFLIYVFFLFFNVNSRLHIRYNGWRNDHMKLDKAYSEIQPYLKTLGIKRSDKIISIGDVTNSYSLTMMNLKGWTQMGTDNNTEDKINEKIRKGAKYLFLKEDKYTKEAYLQPYIKYKIGNYKNISIYSLKQY